MALNFAGITSPVVALLGISAAQLYEPPNVARCLVAFRVSFGACGFRCMDSDFCTASCPIFNLDKARKAANRCKQILRDGLDFETLLRKVTGFVPFYRVCRLSLVHINFGAGILRV